MCVPQSTAHSFWIVSPAQAQHLRGEAAANGFLTIRRWLARRRQLRALKQLDERLLADVGLTREDADREMATALWRAFSRRHLK